MKLHTEWMPEVPEVPETEMPEIDMDMIRMLGDSLEEPSLTEAFV